MQFELQSLVRSPQNPNFLDTFSLGLEEFSAPANAEILSGATEIDWHQAKEFLESKFPEAYLLMHDIGVHPESGRATFFDPTTDSEFVDDFSNIGQHLSCVGLVGFGLASFGVDHGLITEDQARSVVQADLLHDIVKPYQVTLIRALREKRISNDEFLSPDPYYEKVTQYLIGKGFDPKLAASLFTDYGNETGGEPEVLSLFLDANSSGLLPRLLGTPIQHLIHLADDMVASLKPVSGESPRNLLLTPRERLLLTQKRSKDDVGWRAGFGINHEGIIVPVPDVHLNALENIKPIGSYHALMSWISDILICNSLVRAAGIECQLHEAAWKIKEEVWKRLPTNFQ